MPTLSDVAKVAGVGVMSVSRVVNGTRPVSPATERRVRMAIERIGYEPNDAARVLKGHRAHILGLIVPDLADPFVATCANIIHATAWEAGYLTLMAASFNREEIERRETEIMIQKRVAGIVVIPSGSRNEHFQRAHDSGVFIVALDRPLTNVAADTLIVNNREASAAATKHLIDHGHRHILCIADDWNIYTKAERVAGYSNIMRDHGLAVRVVSVGSLSGSLPEQLALALRLKPAPTAIFPTSDVLAVAVLRELQKLSIPIPERMALISFDDFDAATLVRPTITVVRQPTAELGRRAASFLLDRLDPTITPAPHSEVVLPTELVLRGSCGCGDQEQGRR